MARKNYEKENDINREEIFDDEDPDSSFDTSKSIYSDRNENVIYEDNTDPDRLEEDPDYSEEEQEKDLESIVHESDIDIELIESVKMDKDLKRKTMSMKGMSRREIKTVVDLFYQVQKDRIALENQIRAIKQEYDEDSPDSNNMIVLEYLLKNMKIMETNVSNIIKNIVDNDPVGRWLVQIKGIAEILAAGLLAYFDVEGKNYATHFISYAGLNDNNRPWLGKEKSKQIVEDVIKEFEERANEESDSKKKIKIKDLTDEMIEEIALRTQWSYAHIRNRAWNDEKGKWDKGKVVAACAMVPYNRNLKKLMYKVGASFQWQCNKQDSLYGTLFTQRRDYENKKNEAGDYADQAAHQLEVKDIGKSTVAYKYYSVGKLPKAHITARAMRWTEKIFISHLFEEMYRIKNDKIPPRYYILDHGDGHHDEIAPEIPYTKVTGEE